MLEGVPVGGGSVCLIQNLEFKIQNSKLQTPPSLKRHLLYLRGGIKKEERVKIFPREAQSRQASLRMKGDAQAEG